MLDTRMSVRLACCMALALGTAAMAQQSTIPVAEDRGDLDGIRKVSTLIGTDVVNRTNTTVAHVRDLVLSPAGDVSYVVLGYGGVAGVGETNTVAPFSTLRISQAGVKWSALLDMTADDLKNAPAIRSDNYRELTDAQWITRVNQFFRRGDESTAGAVARVILATKIRGSQLKNPQNEDLGKIEELLLNRMNRVAFLIVGRGGTLSIGEHYIPVPWSRLGLNTNPENAAVTLSVNATPAQMEKAPLVKGGDYATLLDSGFADQVRHYFTTIGR